MQLIIKELQMKRFSGMVIGLFISAMGISSIAGDVDGAYFYPQRVFTTTMNPVGVQRILLASIERPNSSGTISLVSSDGGDDWGRQQMWIRKCQDAVREKLKDSDSAKFKDVYFIRGRDKIPTTCGQVNSKNSFGAYSGFERFVSMGSADKTFLKSEFKDFHNLWNRFCTK
jgi:hypothetical protein